MTETVLWDYPKSSASYRVRIALNIAALPYRKEMVNLLDGAHRSPEHLARNPQGLIPVLDIDGARLTQSLAIIDYLDATRGMGLFPDDPLERARVSAVAQAIAVDLHPVCNLSVMRHATGGTEPARTEWMHHFIRPALQNVESLLARFDEGPFAIGETPSLIDLCLIPQLYNADRWSVHYGDCRRISAIQAHCATDPRFINAAPE